MLHIGEKIDEILRQKSAEFLQYNLPCTSNNKENDSINYRQP